MKKTVCARIRWLPADAGGRTTPVPSGARYYPLLVYDDSSLQTAAWSADIRIEKQQSDLFADITLSYLAEEAPHEELRPGRAFTLREGAHITAAGRILHPIEEMNE